MIRYTKRYFTLSKKFRQVLKNKFLVIRLQTVGRGLIKKEIDDLSF